MVKETHIHTYDMPHWYAFKVFVVPITFNLCYFSGYWKKNLSLRLNDTKAWFNHLISEMRTELKLYKVLQQCSDNVSFKTSICQIIVSVHVKSNTGNIFYRFFFSYSSALQFLPIFLSLLFARQGYFQGWVFHITTGQLYNKKSPHFLNI